MVTSECLLAIFLASKDISVGVYLIAFHCIVKRDWLLEKGIAKISSLGASNGNKQC